MINICSNFSLGGDLGLCLQVIPILLHNFFSEDWNLYARVMSINIGP